MQGHRRRPCRQVRHRDGHQHQQNRSCNDYRGATRRRAIQNSRKKCRHLSGSCLTRRCSSVDFGARLGYRLGCQIVRPSNPGGSLERNPPASLTLLPYGPRFPTNPGNFFQPISLPMVVGSSERSSAGATRRGSTVFGCGYH
jgi:hypothetical protein